MSELTAVKFDLSLIYGLTEEGLIESSLRATGVDKHTLYTESYSSEQTVEGYFWPIVDWSPSLKIAFKNQVLGAAKIFTQVATKQVPLFFAAVPAAPPKFWLKLALAAACELTERSSLDTHRANLVLLSPLGNLVWGLQEGQIALHQTKALTSDKLDEGDWSSTLAVWAALRVNFIATIFEALRVVEN